MHCHYYWQGKAMTTLTSENKSFTKITSDFITSTNKSNVILLFLQNMDWKSEIVHKLMLLTVQVIQVTVNKTQSEHFGLQFTNIQIFSSTNGARVRVRRKLNNVL